MTKRTPIVIGIVAAAVLAIGTGLAVGLPALADDNPTPSVSGSTEDGTNDGETNDDNGVEDGTNDGETNDD